MSVLNRIDARIGSPANSLRTMRVSGDLTSKPMRFGDDGFHLVHRVLGSVRIVALRHHAASGADLDDVSAIFDDFADLVLHGSDSVRNAFRFLVIFEREQVVVAMPARDA